MPDRFPAERAEAVRLIEQGSYGAAASLLYRHLSCDRDLVVLANLGKACHAAGDAQSAARVFRICVEHRPEPAFLSGLGHALAALDRPDEAEDCFREAIGRNELFVDAWLGLARLRRLVNGEPLLRRLEGLARDGCLGPRERERILAVLRAH